MNISVFSTLPLLAIAWLNILSASAEAPPSEINKVLLPILEHLAKGQIEQATEKLDELKSTDSIPLVLLNIGQAAVAAASQDPKYPSPAEIEADRKRVNLADCKWQQAAVQWLIPQRNRYNSKQADSYLFNINKEIFTSGLTAHANSSYSFKLDGKWRRLTGKAGLNAPLETLPPSYASVDFIIQLDGKHVFGGRRAQGDPRALDFDIDLTNGKILTLITTDMGNGNAGDHAAWVDLKLSRL